MAMHDAFMIGLNWLKFGFAPEYQNRSECQVCHAIETMDHILTKCQANGQAQIWKFTRQLWYQREKSDLHITLGTILASPSTKLKENRKKKDGTDRLYRLIMTESAHLIWKLRCERVIKKEGEQTSPAEIKNRWVGTMDARLKLDRKMTNVKFTVFCM